MFARLVVPPDDAQIEEEIGCYSLVGASTEPGTGGEKGDAKVGRAPGIVAFPEELGGVEESVRPRVVGCGHGSRRKRECVPSCVLGEMPEEVPIMFAWRCWCCR